jgi:hypothetical protein
MSTSTEAGQRRRRLQLTPMPSIPVEFTGQRAGEGPLTMGQLDVYTWASLAPDLTYAILYDELPVPTMASLDDVAEAAAVLIERHESLRTTYLPGEPPRQRVAAAGVQLLEALSLGEGQWGPRDRPAVPEALIRWLQESPDPARRPVRIAVAVAPGPDKRVIACAAGFTHVAMDQGSIEILKRDFAGLLSQPTRRRSGQAGHQPLDQAEREATPAERRKADAALAYLLEQSRRIPRCLHALPGAQATGESLAVELSSVAAAMAVRQVVARTRTSRSGIVLAAICAVIARRARYPELVIPLASSNRFERHLVNYVGALAQLAIATVDIGERSFDELARHTWNTAMEASRHARYDNVKRDAMMELIKHERGLSLDFDPLFNSLVPAPWPGLTAGTGFQPEEIRRRAHPDRAALAPDAGRPGVDPVQPQPGRRLPATGPVERRRRPGAAGRSGIGAAGRRAPSRKCASARSGSGDPSAAATNDAGRRACATSSASAAASGSRNPCAASRRSSTARSSSGLSSRAASSSGPVAASAKVSAMASTARRSLATTASNAARSAKPRPRAKSPRSASSLGRR